MINRWLDHWMFRCKDVSVLVSQSMDTHLPLSKRMGIRFHLMMCNLCREYKRQLTLISRALKKIDLPVDDEIPDTGIVIPLPESVKSQIKKKIAPSG